MSSYNKANPTATRNWLYRNKLRLQLTYGLTSMSNITRTSNTQNNPPVLNLTSPSPWTGHLPEVLNVDFRGFLPHFISPINSKLIGLFDKEIRVIATFGLPWTLKTIASAIGVPVKGGMIFLGWENLESYGITLVKLLNILSSDKRGRLPS